MKKTILAAFIFMLLSQIVGAQQKVNKDDLEELNYRMIGTFDNQEQASVDASYYSVVLHSKPIWSTKKNKDGYWLYLEQTVSDTPDKPYRQVVYHLSLKEKDDKTLLMNLYEIKNPAQYAGAWRDVSKLKLLRKDSLIERTGCTVFIQKDEFGNFHGNTEGKGCGSVLRNAAYSTSSIDIYPNLFISLDKGFDKTDKQVWGAEKGGYRFRKFTLNKPEEE